VSYNKEDLKIRIKVEQVQEQTQLTGLFKMPVNIAVYFKNGDSLIQKIWVQKQGEDFYFDNPGNNDIDFILFDPGNRILKKITFEKNMGELSAQSRKAPNMIDRYDAFMAMRNMPLSAKREALVWGFQHETFFAIRSEIIKQLMEYDEMFDMVNARILNEHPETIKSFMGTYNRIPNGFLYYYEQWLKHPSYEIEIIALQKLYENNPEKLDYYLQLTKNKSGQNNNLAIKWLEISCQAQKNTTENLDQLINFTSPSYEFRTRVQAFEALKRLNFCNEKIMLNGFEALSSFNGRLSGPVKTVLDYFIQQNTYKKLMTDCYKKCGDEKLRQAVKSNFSFCE